MEKEKLLEGRSTIASYSLTENLVKAIRQDAKNQKRPYSWVVSDALVAYLTSKNRTQNRRMQHERSTG